MGLVPWLFKVKCWAVCHSTLQFAMEKGHLMKEGHSGFILTQYWLSITSWCGKQIMECACVQSSSYNRYSRQVVSLAWQYPKCRNTHCIESKCQIESSYIVNFHVEECLIESNCIVNLHVEESTAFVNSQTKGSFYSSWYPRLWDVFYAYLHDILKNNI